MGGPLAILKEVPARYRAITALLLPGVLIYTLVRSLRDGGRGYLAQRTGRGLPEVAGRVCVHCASVGEVATARPLLAALAARGHACVISVNTPTGYAMAQELLPDVSCVYAPLDFAGPVRRWLDVVQPRALLVVETELWPVLLTTCAARDISVALVNARLTPRTTRVRGLVREVLVGALACAACVLARSESDADAFGAFGVEENKLRVVGNLKTALPVATESESALSVPYVLAVSTHDDEELQLWRAWQQLPEALRVLLVIVPRYPTRARKLCRELQRAGAVVARNANMRTPSADVNVLVVDRLGAVAQWLAGCVFAIVGGSFVERGGHNVCEVAAAGKLCVIGPHSANFADEVRALETAGALITTESDALPALCARLLVEHEQTAQTGCAGRAWLAAQGDVAGAYCAALVAAGVITADETAR